MIVHISAVGGACVLHALACYPWHATTQDHANILRASASPPHPNGEAPIATYLRKVPARKSIPSWRTDSQTHCRNNAAHRRREDMWRTPTDLCKIKGRCSGEGKRFTKPSRARLTIYALHMERRAADCDATNAIRCKCAE